MQAQSRKICRYRCLRKSTVKRTDENGIEDYEVL